MKYILAEVRKLGVDVQFVELKKDGYSIIDLGIIFINQNLHEDKVKEVLIHELAHFKLHSDYSVLYKMDVPRLKMEQEAVDYTISHIIAENGGMYNYTQLIEELKIRMGKDEKFADSRK